MYSDNHLIAALAATVPARPDAPFIRSGAGPALTYRAFFEGADRIAAILASHGVAPGDRVAAQVPKSVTALQLYVGTILAGGVFLPLNTAYKGEEVLYFLEDAEPTVFVTDPAVDPGARPGMTRLTLDADGNGTLTETRAGVGFQPVARGADDLAAILYTSGTTGRPKGAMLSHANLRSNSETLRDLWRFTSDDVLIHALPIFHTHGLFVATNVALLAGASLDFHRSFDAEAILAAMPRATAMMGVPTFYTRLLATEGLGAAARDMRLFVSGSAPLLAETHTAWTERTGHAILERYGMTETNMITSNPYDGDRRPGTVGHPLPGVEVRIVGGDGAPVTDAPGIIEVRGPNVFKGYWQNPEKTAEEFRADGFFVTGDIGETGADGYISIVGRAKDLIISGGFNVYPKEVELAIDRIDGVLESAVIGLPHPDFGEGVAAVVVRDGGIDADGILAAVAPALARFKQPKAVIFVDALPRNAMGKVEKAALRATYRTRFSNDA